VIIVKYNFYIQSRLQPVNSLKMSSFLILSSLLAVVLPAQAEQSAPCQTITTRTCTRHINFDGNSSIIRCLYQTKAYEDNENGEIVVAVGEDGDGNVYPSSYVTTEYEYNTFAVPSRTYKTSPIRVRFRH
jgi:hypothetical protein